MKKYNYFLSALLVPAMILQATTCPGGGSSSGSPGPGGGGSVTGVQTISYTTSTLYNFKVSVSTSAYLASGATYGVWCTNPAGAVPGGGTDAYGNKIAPEIAPEDQGKSPLGSVTYTTVNTYNISSITSGNGGANYGVPGNYFTYDSSAGFTTAGSLTLAQEWSAVNWILNNPKGISGEEPTTTDTQAAIWTLLYSSQGPFITYSGLTGSVLTGNSWLLYKDALANGLNFIPVTGQVVGILMLPNKCSLKQGYQGFVVPVPIACTTAPGSATLTKTTSVTSSGANAFQLVTYTYTVKNTGTTTLGNISILDDNGTPNYPEDDYTVPVPAGTTIAPNSSYSISTSVYLPISLFYQAGTQAAFDTLIPQVVPAATSSAMPSLLLTYLIDSDVTDNSYGSNSSTGWSGNGGHTFAQIEAGYAEFAISNSKGTVMSDFNVNYLKNVGTSGGKYPSGYSSTIGQVYTGGTNYISYLESTLQDNLNDYSQYNTATTTSPAAGSPNWEFTAGYKVLVNEAILGMYNTSFSVAIKKNYLAATETGFSGKCGSPQAFSYTPSIYCSNVTSTAWLWANVCGCSTVVTAKACLTVKMNGVSHPTCNNPGNHICQNPVHCSCPCSQCAAGNHGSCTASKKCTPPVCSCPCDQCKAGNHASCNRVGCDDPTCHANNCNHNTVRCTISSKPVTYCW